jgi:hypothetical protein
MAAVFIIVPRALLGTRIADDGAMLAVLVNERREAGNRCCRVPADRRAVDTAQRALRTVAVLNAFMPAPFAFNGAVGAGPDTARIFHFHVSFSRKPAEEAANIEPLENSCKK